MKKIWAINYVVLSIFFSASFAFGQSNAEIERKLVAAIEAVQKHSAYGENYDDEKLSAANEIFEEKLLKYTKIASTLKHPFTELNKLMSSAASDNGKLRIFSWDTEDGGTMHNYSRVYQFQAADGKVYSRADEKIPAEDGGAGSFVYDIFTLDAKGGVIYIVCSTFVGSTKDHVQSANLYKIAGDTLSDQVKLIKTKSGLTNTLNFEYDFFSVVDRAERPIKLIVFDKKTKTLKIPVVIADEKFPIGRVTERFISYRFDGTHFVKIN